MLLKWNFMFVFMKTNIEKRGRRKRQKYYLLEFLPVAIRMACHTQKLMRSKLWRMIILLRFLFCSRMQLLLITDYASFFTLLWKFSKIISFWLSSDIPSNSHLTPTMSTCTVSTYNERAITIWTRCKFLYKTICFTKNCYYCICYSREKCSNDLFLHLQSII